ncbi:MAG: hypothetical protein ACYDB1_11645 [Acidiferrobacteraceae bacterium]
MNIASLASLWRTHPLFQVGIAVAVAIIALFMLRRRAHRLILLVGQMGAFPFKRTRGALLALAAEIGERNRTVLLAQARHETGGYLEKEFRSVDESLRRDLEAFPELHQALLRQVAAIEDDHRQSGKMPPPPAEWNRLMSVLTRAQPPGDESVQRLWSGLRKDVARAQRQALTDYRRSYEGRHRLLEALRPALERLRDTLAQVDHDLVMLRERAAAIDHYMRRYDAIVAGEDWVVHTLTSSAVVQFMTALFLTVFAGAGYVAQFLLLSLAFSGGTSSGPSHVLAFGLLTLGGLAGLVLTEAGDLSGLVPLPEAIRPGTRRGLVFGALGILLLFASVEAAAALWAPRPPASAGVLGGWGRGEMALCLALLPWPLALAALPIQSLVYSLRAVTGLLMRTLIRFLAALFGLIARLIAQLALAAIILYDALIFVPLALFVLVRRLAASRVFTPSHKGSGRPAADP